MKNKTISILYMLIVMGSSNLISAQDSLLLQDNNPDHMPKLSLSYGFGIGSLPHACFDFMSHAEFSFNIANRALLEMKHDWLFESLKDDYWDVWVPARSGNPMQVFKSYDFSAYIRLFGKKTIDNVSLFRNQENIGSGVVVQNYYITDGGISRHIDLVTGLLIYEDIIGEEGHKYYTVEGPSFDNAHLTFTNKSIQIGLNYSTDQYLLTKYEDRRLQTVITRNYYLVFLYDLNTNIDPIWQSSYYGIEKCNVDPDQSNLDFQKIGFKAGLSRSRNIIGSQIGGRFGAEVSLFPGIKGFNDEIGNISIRVYIQLALNFLKTVDGKLKF